MWNILCLVCFVQLCLNIGLIALSRSYDRENKRLRVRTYELINERDTLRSLYEPYRNSKYRDAYNVIREAICKIQRSSMNLLLDLKSIGLADDGTGNSEIIVESADAPMQSVSPSSN